jgi:hypothetical protein
MGIEGRINKIEKMLEENHTPEDELEKIFQYEKAMQPMAYGPPPEIGWKWPVRPLTDAEVMGHAKWLHKHFHTLDRVKARDAFFDEDAKRSAPILQAAIARCERERAEAGLPPRAKPPEGLNAAEELQWTLHHCKYERWKQEEKGKASKSGSFVPPQPTTEVHTEIQKNQSPEYEIKALDEDDLDPDF